MATLPNTDITNKLEVVSTLSQLTSKGSVELMESNTRTARKKVAVAPKTYTCANHFALLLPSFLCTCQACQAVQENKAPMAKSTQLRRNTGLSKTTRKNSCTPSTATPTSMAMRHAER